MPYHSSMIRIFSNNNNKCMFNMPLVDIHWCDICNVILAMECPDGMIYNHQMLPCQKMCDDVSICTNVGPPIEGCQCRNPLHVLEGGKCIHPDQCGCTYNGIYVSVCHILFICIISFLFLNAVYLSSCISLCLW